MKLRGILSGELTSVPALFFDRQAMSGIAPPPLPVPTLATP
jgi:hypothetical protein